jgi:hypothetical protein
MCVTAFGSREHGCIAKRRAVEADAVEPKPSPAKKTLGPFDPPKLLLYSLELF